MCAHARACMFVYARACVCVCLCVCVCVCARVHLQAYKHAYKLFVLVVEAVGVNIMMDMESVPRCLWGMGYPRGLQAFSVNVARIVAFTETHALLLVYVCLHAAKSLLPQPVELKSLLNPEPGNAVISNPGVSWALRKRDKQLKYPKWLEGTWEVRLEEVLPSPCSSYYRYQQTLFSVPDV